MAHFVPMPYPAWQIKEKPSKHPCESAKIQEGEGSHSIKPAFLKSNLMASAGAPEKSPLAPRLSLIPGRTRVQQPHF